MNKTKKVSRKIIALVLSIVMILSIVPMSASAAEAIKKGLTTDKEVNFAVMSDMHYYPASLAGNYNEAFMKSTKTALARSRISRSVFSNLLSQALPSMQKRTA